ncbi:hypothetical protein YC2023_039209 [Brassica napus]
MAIMDLDCRPGHKGLSQDGIGTRFSMPVNLRTSQNGFLRDGPKRVLRDYMDPHFFLCSFLISYEKNEKESEKKAILVTFLPENIRSSGDDNLSSEVVAGGLIRRHPAGRPAKAYIFCGTGTGDMGYELAKKENSD